MVARESPVLFLVVPPLVILVVPSILGVSCARIMQLIVFAGCSGSASGARWPADAPS